MEPFEATLVGYSTVRVTWAEPSGSWSGFRVVRSRAGYPTNESDGVVLYETTESPALGLTDDDLQGGWVYYAIFLYNSTRAAWERAGETDILVAFDFQSTKRLWDLTPDYYRQVREYGAGINQGLYQVNPAIYLSNEQAVPNNHLLSLLSVFGFSFDILRSEIDTIRDAYDPRAVHQKRLGLLAAQFGGEIYDDVPVQNNRSIIRNLGLLYRKRGTVSGIRELLELATGYDIDVSIGKNLMLSEDQAEFVHPQVEEWNPNTRYVAGDIVRHGPTGSFNYYYTATGVAYGAAQAPPLSATSNAFWDHDRFLNETDQSLYEEARRSDTGDMSTWQIRIAGGAVLPENTWIGMGHVDPVDGTQLNTNSLAFVNKTGSTQDIIVRSIPVKKDEATVLNRKLTVESAIPVPRVPGKWVSGETYDVGDIVSYRGVPYEALKVTTDDPTTTAWKRLGLDDRVRLNMSMYVHGKFAGTAGQGAVASVSPYVMFFDEQGDLITEQTLDSAAVSGVIYDPFYDATALDAARTAPVGAVTWNTGVGTWNAGWTDDGYYRYPTSTSRTYRTVAGTANGNVAVTINEVGTREVGLMFRYSDASNFWIATKTGLKKVVAGAAPANPASGAVSWSALTDGDRLRVNLNGNVITVYRNGAVLGTATDSFNASAVRHGVVMEA